MSSFFKNRDVYSLGALCFTLMGECFALIGIQGFFDKWLYGVCLALALVLIIWVIALCNDVRFGIRSVILTKLLANAITPRWLGVLYLLFFVIHLGWLTNTAMSLFIPTESFDAVLYATLICIVGMMVLILFFPDGKEVKDKKAKEIIVSAISLISVPRSGNYSDLNLRPLVRILQERQINNCEFLILRSDYNKMTDENLSRSINDVMEFIYTYTNEDKSLIPTLLKDKTIKQKIEMLIKKVAQVEFPDQKEEVNNLYIDWTEPCDYNVFKSCHDALMSKIKEKDDKNHRLICYASPGTSLVGVVITLMAIDGNRELYYYSQEKDKEDSERLMLVNKNEIPLKNLLSQALDSIL